MNFYLCVIMPPNDENKNILSESLPPLAAKGQFQRLARYVASSEPLFIRKKAASLLEAYAAEINSEERENIRDQLITAVITDPEEEVQARAIETLIEIDNSAIDTLVEKLLTRNSSTPTETPYPLVLTEWLGSDYSALRLLAVAGLGELGTPRIIPDLAKTCSDPDPRVQQRAIAECGCIGEGECIDALIDCLQSKEIAISSAAASSLIEAGTEKAIQAVLSRATQENPGIRRTAIAEIGTVGSLDIFGFLIYGLEDDREDIRQNAIASCVELICAAPRSESHIIRETVRSQFEAMPDENIIPQLISMYYDADRWPIRRNAIWLLCTAMNSAPSQRVVRFLIRVLAAEDDRTSKLAAILLIELDHPETIKHLETYIRANELESKILTRADFIRDQITEPETEFSLEDTVMFLKVSEPAEYTEKR